ncbi:R-spondin-4 isoform X2 [Alosa pseudoharengus]|uniref:R-spondin-4 isoform X2 n=1 Tax=Alosa pseudoharengus TaxID=34774 RepID=UPI003F8ADBA0
MPLRLFALLILVCNSFMLSSTTRKPRAVKDNPQDCKNCLECSKENGCLRCPEKLFLFLERQGMSHHGSCLHSCPAGHFGMRGKDMNRCMKCKAQECERCFSKDFCTKCKAGFQLFKGKCFSNCPEGTFPHLTDCIEGCLFSPFGYWGEWSLCQHNGLSCGVRWGHQTRTRVLSWKVPEELSSLCPPSKESRRCRMKKRCPKDPMSSGIIRERNMISFTLTWSSHQQSLITPICEEKSTWHSLAFLSARPDYFMSLLIIFISILIAFR